MDYTKSLLAKNIRSFRHDKDKHKRKRMNVSLSKAPQARMCCDICPVADTPRIPLKENEPTNFHSDLNRVFKELDSADAKILMQLNWIKKQEVKNEVMKNGLEELKALVNSHVKYAKVIRHNLDSRLSKFTNENFNEENMLQPDYGELRAIIKIMKSCLKNVAPTKILKRIEELIQSFDLNKYSTPIDKSILGELKETINPSHKNITTINYKEMESDKKNKFAMNLKELDELLQNEFMKKNELQVDCNTIKKTQEVNYNGAILKNNYKESARSNKNVLERINKATQTDSCNDYKESITHSKTITIEQISSPKEVIVDNKLNEEGPAALSDEESNRTSKKQSVRENKELEVVSKEVESIKDKALELIKEKCLLQQERYNTNLKNLENELGILKQELTKVKEENTRLQEQVSIQNKKEDNNDLKTNSNDLLLFLKTACATVEELYSHN